MRHIMTEATDGRMEEPTTWPDLAIGLYDRLTGRDAEISYEFEEMAIRVPSKAGGAADHAEWRLDGSVHITTRERA